MSKLFSELGLTPEAARALVARCQARGLIEHPAVPADVDELCREKVRERDKLKMREIRAKRRSSELHGAALARLQREWAEAAKVEGSRLRVEGGAR